MFYFDILSSFYENEVKYLLVGGLAVNLHGVPRVTNDIDIVISFDKKNVAKIIKIMHELNYIPRLPGVKPEDLLDKEKMNDWSKYRNLKSFSFFQPSAEYRHLDILLVHPLDFDKAFERKQTSAAQGMTINLVNIQDLIEMKKFSGREQDLSDIDHLKRI